MGGTGFLQVTVGANVFYLNVDHIVRVSSASTIWMSDGLSVTVNETPAQIRDGIIVARALPTGG